MDTAVLMHLLQFRFRYGDGRLDRWDEADVDEFLFGYLPKKAMLGHPDLVVPTLVKFFSYLEVHGRISPARRDHLADIAQQVEHDFLERFLDPKSAGQAKSLMQLLTNDGVDIADGDAVQEWLDAFNSLTIDERKELLPLPQDEPSQGSFPPVELADAEELNTAADGAPLLKDVKTFVSFLGDRRKLTDAGNLRLADGRAVCELLGIPFDQEYDGEVIPTRSTTDVRPLMVVVDLAFGSGLVADERGWAVPHAIEEDSRFLARRLLFDWISPQFDPGGWLAWWQVFLVRMREPVLHSMYIGAALGDSPSISEMAGWLWEDFQPRLPSLVDNELIMANWRKSLAKDFERDLLGELEQMSLATINVAEDHAMLTPLGVWAVREFMLSHGHKAPLVGEAAASVASAGELLQRLQRAPVEIFGPEVRALRELRGPGLVDELISIAVNSDDIPIIAMSAIAELGPEESEAGMRRLLEVPNLRAAAASWLVEAGLDVPDDAVDQSDQAAFFAELVASILADEGIEAMLETFASLGPEEETLASISHLGPTRSPAAVKILTVLADEHTSSAVRREARKALMKMRS